MSNENNPFAELFANCWKDEALKARFMADPVAVLAERGIEVPDGIDVNVIENADNTVHITLPMAPGGHEELSMEELSNVAGGGASSWACQQKYHEERIKILHALNK